MFAGNFLLRLHLLGFCIEDGDFSGEILGFQNNGRCKIRQSPAFRHVPFVFHLFGGVAEQGLIAFGSNHAEISVAAGLFVYHAGKLFFSAGKFRAGRYSLCFKNSLLDDFKFSGLNGKIGLGKGNFLFARVAVLGDEVAGVAGEHQIIYGTFPLATGAAGDHFPDASAKWSRSMYVPATSQAVLALETTDLKLSHCSIAKQVLKVASQPELNTVFCLPGVGFKVVGERLDDFGFHVFVPVLSADGRR